MQSHSAVNISSTGVEELSGPNGMQFSSLNVRSGDEHISVTNSCDGVGTGVAVVTGSLETNGVYLHLSVCTKHDIL